MPRKREDLTGRKFGRLVVIDYDHTSPHGDTYWLCECECGNKTVVIRHDLINGRTKSCGCISREYEDLTGQKFNRLTVIGLNRRLPNGKSMWDCVCDCGNENVVEGYNLKLGHVKSCGCYNKEAIGNRSRTHGHRNEKIYAVWRSMKARCKNPREPAYKNYGGRGIAVCNEWDSDFQVFYDWAMNNGYSEGLTIDRINNNDGYHPDNCRWTTHAEQNLNRRSNHLLTYNGKTQTMKEWSEELDINYSTLQRRVNERGWDDERALSTRPNSEQYCYITYANETHTIAEWARLFGIVDTTLRKRINRGDMRDFEDYFDSYENI